MIGRRKEAVAERSRENSHLQLCSDNNVLDSEQDKEILRVRELHWSESGDTENQECISKRRKLVSSHSKTVKGGHIIRTIQKCPVGVGLFPPILQHNLKTYGSRSTIYRGWGISLEKNATRYHHLSCLWAKVRKMLCVYDLLRLSREVVIKPSENVQFLARVLGEGPPNLRRPFSNLAYF